jgi:hypothetical protein
VVEEKVRVVGREGYIGSSTYLPREGKQKRGSPTCGSDGNYAGIEWRGGAIHLLALRPSAPQTSKSGACRLDVLAGLDDLQETMHHSHILGGDQASFFFSPFLAFAVGIRYV